MSWGRGQVAKEGVKDHLGSPLPQGEVHQVLSILQTRWESFPFIDGDLGPRTRLCALSCSETGQKLRSLRCNEDMDDVQDREAGML